MLISIGIISQNGKAFYAENANMQEELCSEFVIETVLPLLEGEVKMWSDAPSYDWPHVFNMFSTYGWPGNLKRAPVPLSFASGVQSMRFYNAVEDIFHSNTSMRRHHALDDAKANRHGFNVATMRSF